MSNIKIKTAILGASGYTGAELVRLLLNHPHVSIVALTGDSQAGKAYGEVYPQFAHLDLPELVTLAEVDYSQIDLVFCCLPHGTTQEVIAGLPDHVKIVDLSADFRLHNVETYAQWYGHAHQAADLQKEAVYGLTEHARDDIKNARLVANPGCYPTSAQLPLIPLLQENAISAEGIIIDAKSGVTGAGRSVRQTNLYAEINEGFSAYGVGAHRHAPEIEQGLSQAADQEIMITFTPHLVPMNRGILSTMYVSLTEGNDVASLKEILNTAYASEAFVHVLKDGERVFTHQVRGTNHCVMNVYADRVKGKAIIVSVIDNLIKGASGQAVQNMNIMYGFDEALSLQATAIFP